MEEPKKRFNELSILFPITTSYTIIYIGMMIADFVLKDVYTAPTAMMVAYGALLVAYAGDKEARRWVGKEEPSRWGSLFVYAWFACLLVALIISSIFKEFAAPADLVKVCLEVLGVFFGSKASKKIYEAKLGKAGDADPIGNEAKVIAFLKERGKAKSGEIQELLKLSRSSVNRILNILEAAGKVKQAGDKKAAYYELP